MGLWGRVFAAGYDRVMAGTEAAGLGMRRSELLRQATGDVVEVGAGTGVNLAHYPDGLRRLVLVEPEEPMARRLRPRAAATGLPVEVVQAPAEALPLPDASFDVAVSTLVLCTVADPARALAELRRVLRPGGTLLFLEHVRSEDPGRARWQDRIDPLWRRWGHGCRCNRPTAAHLAAAGFEISELERGTVPKAPPFVRPLIVGRASSAAR